MGNGITGGMGKGVHRWLRVEQLNLPQPGLRSGRGQLDELVASIEEVGILVPLVVRPLGKGEYAVIAGAGRLEALRLSGAGPKSKVPCVVMDVDDAEATLLALVENVVREDMRPFDEAETARVLVEDYGYTQARVAKALGVRQSAVSMKLSVYRLDAKVIDALRKGLIEMRGARALLPLEDDPRAQRAILKRMIARGLSAAEVSALVAKKRFGKAAVAPISVRLDGVGKGDARTTRRGNLKVTLEAKDHKALRKLWKELQRQL